MTEEEFFFALAEIQGLGWKAELRRFEIRLRKPAARMPLHPSGFCPITAVCEAKTGRALTNGNYPTAAALLEIPRPLADEIALAADGARLGSLRDRLLFVCGLAAPS